MSKDTTAQTKVIIVDDEPITRMDLKEILMGKNYHVVAEAADGFDAIEVCRIYKPDLVLMDIKMPLLDGLSASKVIFEEGLANTVVLLTAYNEYEFINKAKHIGISGYLVKPIDEKSLIPSIEIAMARSIEFEKMRKENQEVNARLENRKTIEKAKGIIMQKEGMGEQEAYDYLRNLSLVKKLSMKTVSEMILLQHGAAVV